MNKYGAEKGKRVVFPSLGIAFKDKTKNGINMKNSTNYLSDARA